MLRSHRRAARASVRFCRGEGHASARLRTVRRTRGCRGQERAQRICLDRPRRSHREGSHRASHWERRTASLGVQQSGQPRRRSKFHGPSAQWCREGCDVPAQYLFGASGRLVFSQLHDRATRYLCGTYAVPMGTYAVENQPDGVGRGGTKYTTRAGERRGPWCREWCDGAAGSYVGVYAYELVDELVAFVRSEDSSRRPVDAGLCRICD